MASDLSLLQADAVAARHAKGEALDPAGAALQDQARGGGRVRLERGKRQRVQASAKQHRTQDEQDGSPHAGPGISRIIPRRMRLVGCDSCRAPSTALIAPQSRAFAEALEPLPRTSLAT